MTNSWEDNMIRIAIVEDEEYYVDQLTGYFHIHENILSADLHNMT